MKELIEIDKLKKWRADRIQNGDCSYDDMTALEGFIETVERVPQEIPDKICGIDIHDLVEIARRPQGEWIRTGRTNVYGGIEVQCSNCKDKVMVQHLEDEWYCRHCGADMGMKGADDDY